MKILNFYKMNEEKKDENIDFPIFENDKEVLFNFIDSVYKVISDKILDEKKESDLSKAAYSKSEKYKRYRKILKRIKDKIEDCVLDESEKISLTFFEYNFLYWKENVS